MKLILAFITAIAIVILIPHESEYKVRATYSLNQEKKPIKTKLAVMPVVEVEEQATASINPVNNIESMICEVFGQDCEMALKIAQCESGVREEAVGDHAIAYMQDGIEYGKSYGIFQIRHLPGRPDPSQLLDAKFNINYAWNLYQRSSWNPWSCKYKLAKQ